MGEVKEEMLLPIDWEFLDACNGFSFDMGGTVLKLVFIDKNDWVEPEKRKPESKGCLRMVNFSRNNLSDALQFISDRAFLTRKSPTDIMEIYSTGFGGSQYADAIMEQICVKNKQLQELDCFNTSFMHLVKSLPRREVLHPLCQTSFKLVKLEYKIQLQVFDKFEGMSDVIDDMMKGDKKEYHFSQINEYECHQDKPLVDEDDLFPCLIVMCGSATGISVLSGDGRSRFIDISIRGGKMLLGLTSLLTGVKNFREIMDLCSKGRSKNVSDTHESILGDANIKKTGENDMYGAWGEMLKDLDEESKDALDNPAFAYGRAVGKTTADFKKEDMARCVLDTHITDLSQLSYQIALSHGLKHVFFVGGFVNHPLVRQILTVEWLRNDLRGMSWNNPQWKQEIRVHFMVHSQSLGAIGALLNHKIEMSKKHKTAAEGKPATGDHNNVENVTHEMNNLSTDDTTTVKEKK